MSESNDQFSLWGWYSWISPWLLDQSEDLTQLIPLGNPSVARIIAGQNVSYDRVRISEEYNLAGSRTCFLDTMVLHVTVKGISSHQCPVWMKHRKSKPEERELAAEAEEVVVALLDETKSRQAVEPDGNKRKELDTMRTAIEESLLPNTAQNDDAREEAENKSWEDITSANSLAVVTHLHYGIDTEKEIRNDFMECKPAEIQANNQDYLNMINI